MIKVNQSQGQQVGGRLRIPYYPLTCMNGGSVIQRYLLDNVMSGSTHRRMSKARRWGG